MPSINVGGYISARSSGYLSARSSVAAKEYVQRLDVRYGEDAFDMPADAIREINNLNGEVSCQDGGK